MQNKSRLKIWVCEYVSAGGLASEALPASLLQEGLLMRDALLADLSALDVDCITSHDIRVPPPNHVPSLPVHPGDDVITLWRDQISCSEIDACWVIAPETDSVLLRMCELVREAGKRWIGPTTNAISRTSSKARMADICLAAGIPVIPHTYLQKSMLLQTVPFYALATSGWVVKPEDGAGCGLTYYFKNDSELIEFNNKINSDIAFSYDKLLLQPYLPGKPLSMSVLSTQDQVKVIAGHEQWINVEEHQFRFQGAGVNKAASFLPMMQTMAENIHSAISGLTGYWGADMILTDDQALTLVEVNPRLTTPYIGLSRLLAENPAQMILDAVLDNKLTMVEAQSSFPLSLPSAGLALSERQVGCMTRSVIGWDIGGAHVKAVMLDPQGAVVRISQQACALWKGLHLLEATLQGVLEAWQLQPGQCQHVVTMTGELVDLFEHRIQGVRAIVETVSKHIPGAQFYIASPETGASFTKNVHGFEQHIASMNWHASAQCLAETSEADSLLVVDVGSTTTDITLCHARQVTANGWTDAERMANHGLLYTGVVRTPLMALGPYIDWNQQPRHIAAEYFATTADVYRVLGELPPEHDLADTADGQDRSLSASMRRLARMVGHDLEDADTATWQSLAQAFRQKQLLCVLDAIQSSISQLEPQPAAITGLGAGSFLLAELAKILNLPYIPATSWISATHTKLKNDAEVCFPAYAVARLWQTWH